jgi:hypothetical protein
VYYYLVLNTVEIPCFDLFERKQSAATGAQHQQHGLDKRSEEGDSADAADADIAITSTAVVRAQNRHGEVVKLEDLKYCFQSQKQMSADLRSE